MATVTQSQYGAADQGVTAGLAAMESAATVAGAAMEFWLGVVGAQAQVLHDGITAMTDKARSRSWYRHPDMISVESPFGRIALGVTPWSMAMDWFHANARTSFWQPSVLFFGSGSWGTLPFTTIYPAGAMLPIMGYLGSASGVPIVAPTLTADMFTPFACYRSEGGHASAQIVF